MAPFNKVKKAKGKGIKGKGKERAKDKKKMATATVTTTKTMPQSWQDMGQMESSDENLWSPVPPRRPAITPRKPAATVGLPTPVTGGSRPPAASGRRVRGNPPAAAAGSSTMPPPLAPPAGDGPANNETPLSLENLTANSLKRASEFNLRMSHGWTVGDGTFDPIPQDKRRKRDVPYPTFVSHSYRARSALSSLQISRDAPIPLAALDVTCDHLWKCMPGEARRYLHIEKPNGPALWGNSEESKESMYNKMDDKKFHVNIDASNNQTEYRLYADLKKRPWVIWPLWVEDQWGKDYVTVIWYSENTAEDIDRFDQLRAYAIIDPRRSPDVDANQRHPPIQGRLDRIRARLFELWGKVGFQVQGAQSLNVLCSPMPFTEATSGERCFAVVKALVNQVIDWYTSGQQFNHSTTITSMTQWVNPFQQRIEMTGICAWILMATLDYNARIAVEAILPNTRWDVVADGNKKFVYPYDLAGPYEEPPIASYDYLLPPNQTYTAPK